MVLIVGNDVVRRRHSALSYMLRHQEEVEVGDARNRVVDDSAWVRVHGLAVLSAKRQQRMIQLANE